MSNAGVAAARARSNITGLLLRVLDWLEAIPYSVLAVPLRLGLAWIFWNAGQVKLINWETTLIMFRDEYQVPLLPPRWLPIWR